MADLAEASSNQPALARTGEALTAAALTENPLLRQMAVMVGIVAYNWWHVKRNLEPQRDAAVQLLETLD